MRQVEVVDRVHETKVPGTEELFALKSTGGEFIINDLLDDGRPAAEDFFSHNVQIVVLGCHPLQKFVKREALHRVPH
jgi:hypothetical protein